MPTSSAPTAAASTKSTVIHEHPPCAEYCQKLLKRLESLEDGLIECRSFATLLEVYFCHVPDNNPTLAPIEIYPGLQLLLRRLSELVDESDPRGIENPLAHAEVNHA